MQLPLLISPISLSTHGLAALPVGFVSRAGDMRRDSPHGHVSVVWAMSVTGTGTTAGEEERAFGAIKMFTPHNHFKGLCLIISDTASRDE